MTGLTRFAQPGPDAFTFGDPLAVLLKISSAYYVFCISSAKHYIFFYHASEIYQTRSDCSFEKSDNLPMHPHKVFGNLGRRAIYFQGAGEHGNYLQGFGEQAHSFGDLGSPARK